MHFVEAKSFNTLFFPAEDMDENVSVDANDDANRNNAVAQNMSPTSSQELEINESIADQGNDPHESTYRPGAAG